MGIAHSSLAEYLGVDFRPDREFIDGEIRERNVGKTEHARVQALPKLFTADSLVEDLVQGGADAVLVAVNRGAIQVPVSSQDGALDGCRYFLRRGVIGTECR